MSKNVQLLLAGLITLTLIVGKVKGTFEAAPWGIILAPVIAVVALKLFSAVIGWGIDNKDD